jgi:mRNA interferase MazF
VERFSVGDIVFLPFPYSDLSNAKLRPALILAETSYNDFILVQITSQNVKNNLSITLNEQDIIDGHLVKISNIRPDKIFTGNELIFRKRVAHVSRTVINNTVSTIIKLLQPKD